MKESGKSPSGKGGDNMAFVVGEVTAPVTADVTSFSGSMDKVKNMGDSVSASISKSFEKIGTKMKDVGANMTKYITLPLSGMAVYGAKAAIDYETAFAGVRKTVDMTEEEYSALSDAMREMSKEIPASASAIAGVGEAAGQLGIKNENILSFARTMIDLGEATNLSSEQAATSLARLANITQMPQDQFDRLGSTVVALGNSLATTEAEIVDMSMGLAGAGKQVGMSEAEIMSFAGALSSVGIEAQAGGTAFSRVMAQIQLAAETGSEDLGAFADVAGMSADQFKKSFQDNAAGAMISFIEGLGTAEERGVSAIKVLDDMGITEIRLRDALLRASGAGDLFSNSIAIGTAAWEENTALTKEAEQRYATMASKLSIMKNTITDTAISLGEILVPYIEKATEKIKDFAAWFGNLTPGQKEMVVIIGAIVAAIGPLLLILGMAATSIGALIPVFAALTAPIMGTIAAIIGIVAALTYMWKTNEDFRDAVIKVWKSIQRAASAIFDGLKAFWEDWGGAIKGIFDILVVAFKTTWEHIQNVITTMLNVISGIIDFLVAVFTGDWKGAWDAVGKIFSSIWEGIKKNLFISLDNIKDTISIFLRALPEEMAKAGRNIIDGLVQGIKSKIDAAGEAMRSVAKKIRDFLPFSPAKEGPLRAIPDFTSHLITPAEKALGELDRVMKNGLNAISFGKELPVGPTVPPFNAGISSMNENPAWAGAPQIINIPVKIEGPIYGLLDFDSRVKAAIREAIQGGGFRGILPT
jgi:TP901 family phage tail tape measure protein